jgi:hypothetical protein
VTVELGPAAEENTVRVQPDVVTAAGLYLRDCQATGVGGAAGPPVRATIRLAGPGSTAAAEVHSGFA